MKRKNIKNLFFLAIAFIVEPIPLIEKGGAF
jgi:hypothetical protein